jgi:hypothetical protein
MSRQWTTREPAKPNQETPEVRHRLAVVISAALVAALLVGCSSSQKSASTTSSSAAPPAAGSPGAFAYTHYTTPLAGVCPNPFIVQADWLPEADHGFLYEMIGGGGTSSRYTYQGPLGSTGINLEIISGGPGLGNGVNQPSSLYVGNLVKKVTPDATFVSNDDAIQFSKQFPTTAVFSEYEKSPQVIIFDPSKYHIASFSDLKAAVANGAKIYVQSTNLSFVRWVEGLGIPPSAFIGGYQGDLEKFVGSAGTVLNQGFATNEVYTLEHLTPTWNKPVGFAYLADLGFPFYQSAVAVATSKLASLSACLQKLVPIMQHALVDYVRDPTEVNTRLADFNSQGLGAAFWHTPVDLSNAAVQIMLKDHLVANARGTTSVGGFDTEAVNKVIGELVPIFQAAGLDSSNPALKPGDIATNKFIDPGIGL